MTQPINSTPGPFGPGSRVRVTRSTESPFEDERVAAGSTGIVGTSRYSYTAGLPEGRGAAWIVTVKLDDGRILGFLDSELEQL